MAAFSPTDGANEREPTLISDGSLQDTQGAEYRVGEIGLYVARGRDKVGSITSSGAAAPTAVAPDAVVDSAGTAVPPLIWFRGDDDAQGHADASNALIITESATNNFSNFIDGSASGSSNGVEFHSAAGSENMLGHVCVSNRATATDLSLNGGENGDSGLYDASVKLTGDFTCLVVYGFIAAGPANTNDCWAIGAGRGNGTARSGVAVPNSQSSVLPRIFTDDGASGNLTDIGVAYADATDGIRVGIFRRQGTTAKYFGTKTAGDTTVSLSTTNANIAGDVHFNGLMSEGTSTCPIGVKFAEIAVYDSYLTDAQVLQLYQWGAERFSLTAVQADESTTVPAGVSSTGVGLYEAGFDASAGFIVAHAGNSLHAAPVANSLSFSLIDQLPAGSSATVGAHYANRHYTANGKSNRKLEKSGTGITSFPIGMSTSTFVIGVSVTQGAGLISATTGQEYWVTEYDSTRGIESIHGSTAHTGVISLKDGIIAIVTGVSANPRADKLRWYKSVDGGGFPDGGLIQTTAIGTTQITDSSAQTGTLTVPQYGIISIGGLDTDRDEAPDAMSIIFGPFQDSLLGVATAAPRVLRFTPAGFPDSWPSGYGIPMESPRRDEIFTGVVLPGRIGVFCKDSVHTVYRLPRDADSIFAAGEAQDILTDERGCMSRRGATTFTPPGGSPLAAWVARDGIWATDLVSPPTPVTDTIDWEARVDIPNLATCRLMNDPLNRRLVFIHRKKTDTTHNTGIWYLDYQRLQDKGSRITFADHGPLADAVTIGGPDGLRRVYSIDSRTANGQVYVESGQDVDDSLLVDSSGSVKFRMRTKEFTPAGPRGVINLGKATWMHDAGPAKITHRFFHNRRDSNPEVKELSDPTIRTASDTTLQRSVNSFYLEIESVGTTSYGVHWVDVEGFEIGPLGGLKGL